MAEKAQNKDETQINNQKNEQTKITYIAYSKLLTEKNKSKSLKKTAARKILKGKKLLAGKKTCSYQFLSVESSGMNKNFSRSNAILFNNKTTRNFFYTFQVLCQIPLIKLIKKWYFSNTPLRVVKSTPI